MDKERIAAILGNQLKGIMLHVDLMKVHLLQNNKRCSMKHFRQVMEETKNFLLTNEYIIECIGEIVEPAREPQIIVPHDAAPMKLFAVWQAWEKEAVEMYEEAIAADPKCWWWKKLKCNAEHEIK